MKLKEIITEVRHAAALDSSPREPDYKSKTGWRRRVWYVVHMMENWCRPF
ncbi:hypothetical protein [Rhizobium leguminosarum]|nr:hypothetical protein [Rhizobium leguminosarum]